VSLVAVLIPLLFMGDVVGRLFREFAVTLAITILISAVVSLTLVPMMSARWLRRAPGGERAGTGWRAAARGFDRVIHHYDQALVWVLARQGADAAGGAGTLVLTVLLYMADSQGPVPHPGHRPAAGAGGGGAVHLVPRMASCSRRWRRHPGRTPDVSIAQLLVGVDAANNTMLHTGRMLINLKDKRRGSQQRGDGPPARARGRRWPA
jgi:multidrug efflux pump